MANYLGGFSPLRTGAGSGWNARITPYVAAGNIYVGDMVKLNASGAIPTVGLTYTKAALKGVVQISNTATDAAVGVVVGVAQVPGSLDTPTGTTAAAVSGQIVYVMDDPNALFEAKWQTGTFTYANLSKNTGVYTTGTNAAGRSVMQIDTTLGNAATATLKVVGFVDAPDNDQTAATPIMVVKINNHQLAAGTGVVGV